VSWKRWLIVGVSFAAALAAAGWVVRSAWPSGEIPASVPLWAHALAAAAFLTEIATRSAKVMLSARALGVPLHFWDAVRMGLGGDFGSAITPARSGAEPSRFLILVESGVRPGSAALILFAELFLEGIALAVVAAVLVLTFRTGSGTASSVAGTVVTYTGGVVVLGIVGAVLAKRYAHGPPPPVVRSVGLHAGHWRAVQRLLRQLRDGITGLRVARRRYLAGSLLMSVLHIAVRLSILPVLLWGLGVRDAPRDQLLLWPLVLLYGGAAVPAPAGGGVIELTFRAALQDVIPASALGASLVWWRVYTFYLYPVCGALAAGSIVLLALRKRDAH
jgi:uncharacterized protein (TIRG00374 family)